MSESHPYEEWLAATRRTTSIEWPIEVDDRLRILVRLVTKEVYEAADRGECPLPGRTPSAAVVLSNIILGLPLQKLALLGQAPGTAVLQEAAAVNGKFSVVDRDPWLGRPRSWAKPLRIQQHRGRRLPDFTISVARPSKFGSPFKISAHRGRWYVDAGPLGTWEFGDQADAHTASAGLYRDWLDGDTQLRSEELDKRRARILNELATLRGYSLACYCAPELQCHVDYLLVRSNSEPMGIS